MPPDSRPPRARKRRFVEDDDVPPPRRPVNWRAIWVITGLAVAVLLGVIAAAYRERLPSLALVRAGAAASDADPANYVGRVRFDTVFRGSGDSRLAGSRVTFRPGARTNWHSHPLGQLLVVMDGEGWAQAAGGPKRLMRKGDVVWTAPGVRHWHGATASRPLVQFGVAEQAGSRGATWFDPVTDVDYYAPVGTH